MTEDKETKVQTTRVPTHKLFKQIEDP